MKLSTWFARRRFSFEIEGVRGHNICGWVFRRDAPLHRVCVAIETDHGLTPCRLADAYRADVHKAGIGNDGYCGFSLPFDAQQTFRFRLITLEPRYVLADCRGQEKQKPSTFCQNGNLLFCLDRIEGRLSGWISSLDEPDTKRRVRLLMQGRLSYEQSACLFRKDAPAGAGDAFHGFSIPLPVGRGAIELVDAASGRCLHAREAMTS